MLTLLRKLYCTLWQKKDRIASRLREEESFLWKGKLIEERLNRRDACDCQHLQEKVIPYNCLGCIVSRIKRQWSIDSKFTVVEKRSLGLQV